MQRPDRQDEDPETQRSRASSRRNSASLSLSRRNSLKKEKERRSPLNTAPNSSTSTPKKQPPGKQQNPDFVVTGKQILKRSDRANSLPGAYQRRASIDSAAGSRAKRTDVLKKPAAAAAGLPQSQETSLEDDMTLDLSQVSDFEDTSSKYGQFQALATSTPKCPPRAKPRSASLQHQLHSQKVDNRRVLKSGGPCKPSQETPQPCSPDSFRASTIDSPHRYPVDVDVDYSSVSPEYSGQSSTDVSPGRTAQTRSLGSQDLQVSSCCVSTWQDSSSADRTKVEDNPPAGEWNQFWANYNNSLAKVPIKSYYDQCPTPYRTDTFDLADFEFSDGSRKRSPDNMQTINNIICNEGLHLTLRETQSIIKCAHMLSNVISKAIERRTQKTGEDPELFSKKRNLTLDLQETNLPVEVKEEKRWETVTTQTDISLPNTKTAPRIFENILRQLSRNSIDVEKIKNKEEGEEKKEE